MDQWTPKVKARRQLAELLLEQPERYRQAKLLERDLRSLADEGRSAEEADAEQTEQIAEEAAARAATAEAERTLFARETQLRDVMAAVVDDLFDENAELAAWVAALSFAREAAAVAAQKRKWNAVRRLVAVAVRGDHELEAKLAEC